MLTADVPAVAVCVPVRDERRRLPHLVNALAAQLRAPPFTLCVLFDGCEDGGDAWMQDVAANQPFPMRMHIAERLPDAHAGRARRAAMALGKHAIGTQPAALLLSTDADTAPAPDWVAASVKALDQADVVAGLITRDDAGRDPVQGRLEAYLDRLYALRRRVDPLPWEAAVTHHFTGGASLGFRAEAYTRLGGFADIASGEDAVTVDRARRIGLRVRHDRAVSVVTSSRRTGRSPSGLALSLRQFGGVRATEPEVSHPADALWQYERHAAARAMWAPALTTDVVARLATLLGLPSREVAEVAGETANAEAFATRIVPPPPGPARPVPLARAELLLDEIEAAQTARDRAA